MQKIDTAIIISLAAEAKLKIEPEDLNSYVLHLNNLQQLIAPLLAIDTTNIEPLTTPLGFLHP